MRCFIVLKKELKENLRKKRIILSAIFFIIVCFLSLGISTYALLNVASAVMNLLVITIVSIFPILGLFIVYSMIFQDVVFVEKVKKGYENLLSTPLSVYDIIIGKSLFIFSYTYPLMLLLMALFLGALRLLNVEFSIVYVIIYLTIIYPVITLATSLILVTAIMQFRSGQQIMQVLMILVMAGTGGLFYLTPYAIPFIQNTSPAYLLVPLLVMAIILLLLAVAILKSANREKIILTS